MRRLWLSFVAGVIVSGVAAGADGATSPPPIAERVIPSAYVWLSGGSVAYLKNQRGVVIKLHSQTAGLRFNLSADGMRITLQRPQGDGCESEGVGIEPPSMGHVRR